MSDASQPSGLVAANLMLVEIVRKLVVGDAAKDLSPVDGMAAADLAAAGREIEQLKTNLEFSDREVVRLNCALIDLINKQNRPVSAPVVPEAVIDTKKMFKASQAQPAPEPSRMGRITPAVPVAKEPAPTQVGEPVAEFVLPVIPKNRSCIIMGREIVSRSGRHTCTNANTAKMVGKLGGGGSHFLGDLAQDYGFKGADRARSALVGLENHLQKIGLDLHLTDHEASLSAAPVGGR